MCIYNVAVLSILGVILVFVLDRQIQLQYVLTSGFLIFGTTIIQLIIFIPKVSKSIYDAQMIEVYFVLVYLLIFWSIITIILFIKLCFHR